MSVLKELPAFIKYRIALLSTLSAATGFIVADRGFSWKLPLFILALFLLAGGAAALNQYQERALDKLMLRTKDRPLPTGRMTPLQGLVAAIVFLAAGHILMYPFFGALPTVLGSATVVLYNGMYTYLKRVTAFAAVPGALIGALPPAIGWIAAGGPVNSTELFGLVIFFYMWQVPHFWLLLGLHSRDYNRAGFPSMTDLFSSRQLARITFTWVAATACTGLLFPLFGIFSHTLSLAVLIGLIIWLSVHSLALLRAKISTPVAFKKVFVNINIFALLLMIMLIIDYGVLI